MVRILNLNLVPGACPASGAGICASNFAIMVLHAARKKYEDAHLIHRHVWKRTIDFGHSPQGWKQCCPLIKSIIYKLSKLIITLTIERHNLDKKHYVKIDNNNIPIKVIKSEFIKYKGTFLYFF